MSNVVMDAIKVCKELAAFLVDENQALRERRIEFVESNLKQKNRMATDMEKNLKKVHDERDSLASNPVTKRALKDLQVALDDYRRHARQNLMLLQAAHNATADFLMMVKEAVEAKKPKVNTYGKDGAVSQAAGNVSLVNKAI